jgi:hypothetical protein
MKPAVNEGIDTVDGVTREWFKVGRHMFAVTDDGWLLDAEGFPMSGLDCRGNVIGYVHDQDAYRVAEAIRAARELTAEIVGIVGKIVRNKALH